MSFWGLPIKTLHKYNDSAVLKLVAIIAAMSAHNTTLPRQVFSTGVECVQLGQCKLLPEQLNLSLTICIELVCGLQACYDYCRYSIFTAFTLMAQADNTSGSFTWEAVIPTAAREMAAANSG